MNTRQHPLKRCRGLGILLSVIGSITLGITTASAETLNSQQVQSINSSLIPSSSQDFFALGRQQLETEIVRLFQQAFYPSEPILEVDKTLGLNSNILPTTGQMPVPAPQFPQRQHTNPYLGD